MTNVTICRLMIWGQTFNMFPDVTGSYVIAAMMSLLNIFIVLANLAAILTFTYAKCAARRKQCDSVKVENGITKILMISMVISDAIFGVTGMPLMVIELYHSGHWTLGPTCCFIKVLAHYIWCPLVMCHVVCMAVDRFLAVCKPLVYRSLSFKVGYGLVGLCWALSLLVVITPMAANWLNSVEDAQPCAESNSVCDFRRSMVFVILNYVFLGFSPITAILLLYFFIVKDILRSSKRIANSCSIRIHPHHVDCVKSKTNFTDEEQSEKGVEKNVEHFFSTSGPKILTPNISSLCFFDSVSSSSDVHTQVKSLAVSEKCEPRSLEPRSQALGVKNHFDSNVNTNILTSADPECAQLMAYTIPERLDMSVKKDTLINPHDTNLPDTHSVHDLNKSNKLRFSFIRLPTFKLNRRFPKTPQTQGHRQGFRKMRAVRTIGFVVMCFSITWLPVIITVPICTMTGSQMPSWLILVICFCNYSNAALDPVLFCCNRDCKITIRNMVSKIFGYFSHH